MHFAAVAYVGESTLEPLRSFSFSFLDLNCVVITFLELEIFRVVCQMCCNIS